MIQDRLVTWFGARLLLVAVVFAVLWVAVPVKVFAGFGITPPYVRSDRLTQGSTFTQEIIIVRGDPVEDLKAEITINVPGVDGWFSIDKGNEFLLPAGAKQVPMNVSVRVPRDAAYERHQGTIRIRTTSPNPASGVSIALGAQLDVDIRVVDEIRDFEVRRVQLSEAEEPRRALWLEFPGKIAFTMGIENTGNAPVAPSKVQFDIYDRRGNVVLETTTNTNQIEEVAPFAVQDVTAYLPTRLPPGAYLVKYSIYRYEDDIKRNGELTLSVLPKGTLTAYAGYGLEGLSLRDQLSLLVPVALLLIVLIVIVVLTMRRGSRRRPKSRARRHESNSHDDDSMRSPPPAARVTSTHGVVDLSKGRRSR